MKNYLFFCLLSVFSLTAFAQDKKSITISPIQCQNSVVADMVKEHLIYAFVQSDEWQVLENKSVAEIKEDFARGAIGDLPAAQYMLTTEIQDMQDMCYISCRIINKEIGAVIRSASAMVESSPQNIQQACASLANQLLEKQ